AFRQFNAYLPQIEAATWRRVSTSNMLPEHLEQANNSLSVDIRAALRLGNLDFIRPNLAWLPNLFRHQYDMPEQMLKPYLHAYIAAVEAQMGERGALISEWLRRMAYIEGWDEEPELVHKSEGRAHENRLARQDVVASSAKRLA